jgi:hypothetical protein
MCLKSTSSTVIFLLFAMAAFNQEKFTGIIEYKTVSYGTNKKPAGPEKISIVYGTDKAVMRMEGSLPDGNGWILVNTLKDSVWITEHKTKTYFRLHLKNQMSEGPQFVKTDSFRNYYGYLCRGYKGEDGEKSGGYLWVTEDMTWVTSQKDYRHTAFWMMGGNNLLMCLEIYENGQRVGAYFPQNMTKMDTVPDSLFGISGYREQSLDWLQERATTDTARWTMSQDTISSLKDLKVVMGETKLKKTGAKTTKRNPPRKRPQKRTIPRKKSIATIIKNTPPITVCARFTRPQTPGWIIDKNQSAIIPWPCG